jgi:hypothetical protein
MAINNSMNGKETLRMDRFLFEELFAVNGSW